MDVLIIGMSSIAMRRVVPALKGIPEVKHIDVATRKAADPEIRRGWTHGEMYESYEKALERTTAQLVYISLVNSEHERWAEAGLEHGMHVIVDKPAFLGCERATKMVELAAKRDVCLAEATVFGYHPQIEIARQLFDNSGSGPARISIALSFPPMDESNFRYQAALGGGALWDLGPYLVAAGRIFFGSEPKTVDCRKLASRATGVETAFSAMGTFDGGRSLVGHFGFDTAYVNRLQLIGTSLIVEIDRAFTTPVDHPNVVRVVGPNGQSQISVEAADAFRNFLAYVLGRVTARAWGSLAADVLTDARALDAYRRAAVSA